MKHLKKTSQREELLQTVSGQPRPPSFCVRCRRAVLDSRMGDEIEDDDYGDEDFGEEEGLDEALGDIEPSLEDA